MPLRAALQVLAARRGAVSPPEEGRAFWSLDPSGAAEDLDAIPSETSEAERRFLYRFFAHVWRGGGHVVEIGPFLGGTTRAIACGMLANPTRSAASRLYTYDRFGDYYYADELRAYAAPLAARGVVGAADLEAIGTGASFEGAGFHELFLRIHRGTAYESLLVVESQALPETPDEAGARPAFGLPEGAVSAFFVDGCKSWYATKHFFQEALPRASTGAYFIFQDYGWYTDFWVSAAIHLLRDALTLVAHVDQTYAFQVTAHPDVHSAVPDTAEEVGANALADAFDALTDEARRRGDERAAVVHRIHAVAALAYVGAKDDARRRLRALAREHGRGPHAEAIAAAHANPTHRQRWTHEGVVTEQVTL